MQQTLKTLYIHIPFCLSKCDYCDFFSIPCSCIPDEYVTALLNECAFYCRRFRVDGFKTVYLGGGTPSLLSAAQLDRLLSSLKSFGSACASEITVEMNPETVTKEKLEAVQANGVNRLSLGVQSLHDEALAAVHRHCSAEKALEGLETVASIWNGDVSLDVMAGLPGQTERTFKDSLEQILSFNSEHISLYSLTVEEGTPLYKRIKNGFVLNEDEIDEQWFLGREMLLEHGYRQYGVSNFAKPGHESRHNSAYWQQEDYIGIGCGATGTVYDFSSGGQGFRWKNEESLDSYLSFWLDAADEERWLEKAPLVRENLDLATQEFEFLMMGLRTLKGVCADEYRKRFSALEPWKGDIAFRLGESDGIWKRFSDENKCSVVQIAGGGKQYALTNEGLLFLNTFLRYLT